MNYSKHRNDFERAIYNSKLSSSQKLVANALRYHMNNDTGKCFPSLKTLAADCSIGESTVKRARDALEEAGYITKIEGNGRGKPTQYTLHVIQSDVDNRNKHKGNTANLSPSYSAAVDINPNDHLQVDFDDESTTDEAEIEYKPEVASRNTSNDPLTVLDEYGQAISLSELPENERTDFALNLFTVPASDRRRLLKGRLERLREQEQKTLHSNIDHDTSNQTGLYDELNEISQEADDDPYDF